MNNESPKGNAENAAGELPVILKTYDLAIWSCEKVEKFPRRQKFTLGARLENTCFELLDAVVSAKYSHDKLALLQSASTILTRLRFVYRMARDLRLISVKSHGYAARCIRDIGRQLAGWQGHVASRAR